MKPKKLQLKNLMDLLKLTRWLGVDDARHEQVHFTNQRVNRLIGQICTNLIGFISMLILFYLIVLLKDADSATFNKWNSPYPILDFVAVSTNVGSAAFIYLCFIILYNITLDSQNKTSNYYWDTILFCGFFVLSYAFFLGIMPIFLNPLYSLSVSSARASFSYLSLPASGTGCCTPTFI